MRIMMLALGSRGDIQPYVALGLGLQAAGHEVCLATHASYETFIRHHGLTFFPVAGDLQAIYASLDGEALLDTGWNLVGFMRRLIRLAAPLAHQVLTDLWHACQGAEAIIYSTLAFAGYHMAQELGILAYAACLQPVSRTREFPSLFALPQLRLGKSYNWLTHLCTEQIFWQFCRPLINTWRREQKWSPVPFCGSFGEFYQQKCPIMHGYSALIVPQPRDWGDACAITGYWFLNHPPHWRPPGALVDFLAAGPAPVCVGFGSMHTRSLAVRVDLVLQALARLRQRGVLLTGWGGVSNVALPNGIFQIEEVPHDWLFPRVSVVIHHGGAGTTAAALWAGVPAIVLPFYFDQAFWGQRVAALGVGPRPIPRRRLSVEVLTTALQAATSQPAMRWRAAALGRRIHAEDGVARAVQFFHQHLYRR